MKINISGLGVVPDLRISLKPLTVFVGENGTGKTWTAYTIAAILGHYGFTKYVQAYLRGESAFRYPSIENTISDLIEKGSAALNIVQFFEENAENYVNEIAKSASSWMNGFMATSQVDFAKMAVRAELPEAEQNALSGKLKGSKRKLEASIGVKKDSSELEVKCLKEKDSDHLYFYTTYAIGSREIPRPVIDEEIREFVVITIFHIIGAVLFTDVLIFPTERTTFTTLPFSHNQEEHRRDVKLKKETQPEAGIAWRLPEPVREVHRIIESCAGQYFVNKEERVRDPGISQLIKLGKFLEDEILFGAISARRHANRLELMYNPSESVSLELNVSSSMVKELTPLVLYLKYLANPGDLIVIDEPEMNLHPVAQVQIAEFLGMLVNAGLYVLITTHSPYIVDHIPNLIRAHGLDKEKVREYFYLEQTTAFLSKEDVSVYLFESDSVTDILKEDGDIDWGTFSDVSRDLSVIYSNLIQ